MLLNVVKLTRWLIPVLFLIGSMAPNGTRPALVAPVHVVPSWLASNRDCNNGPANELFCVNSRSQCRIDISFPAVFAFKTKIPDKRCVCHPAFVRRFSRLPFCG